MKKKFQFINAITNHKSQSLNLKLTRFLYFSFLIFNFSFVALAAVAADIPLVQGDKAAVEIVIPKGANAIEKYAAEELAYHIMRACGVKPAMVPEDAQAAVPYRYYVGWTKRAQDEGLKREQFAHEERKVKPIAGGVLLVGGDVPIWKKEQIASFWGPSAKGTLYAVYDYLETELGVKWLWPGESGTYVPTRKMVRHVEKERGGIEPLAMRFWHGIGGAEEKQMYGWKDPAARARFFEAQTKFMIRHRIGQRINMRSGHSFGKYVDRFFATHPEYFQLKPDGTRGPWHPGKTGWNCSMCVSNPDVAKQLVADWYEVYAKSAGKGAIPLMPVVNACENDTPGACRCANCRAWDGPDPRFKQNAYWNGSRDADPEMSSSLGIYGRLADMNRWGESATKPPTPYSANVSDRYAKFYNAVLKEARVKVPEARVVAYAYQNYMEGPLATQVDPGVIIDFVPRMYLPYDKAESDFMRTAWENWRKAGVKDLIFRPNFTHAFGGFPVDQARQYCEDIAWCMQRGLFAITLDSVMGSYSAEAMHDYAITRSFREPTRGYEKARADMISAFGAAADDINRYFDFIENHSRSWTHESFEKIRQANPIRGGIFGGGFNRQANILPDFYSEAFFTQAYALLDAAEKAAGNDAVVRERIAFLRVGIVNTELTRKTRLARKALEADLKNAEKQSAFDAAFKTMNDYRLSIPFECALNLHREAVNEFKQLQWPHEALEVDVKKKNAKNAKGAQRVTAKVLPILSALPDKGEALAPNAFETFPAGTIKPAGWLKYQLNLQTEGLQGRLYETSEFLTLENGWLDPTKTGWEEQAYWLRTFVKLAILTGNERMLGVSRKWMDGIIATADKDGWFGPRELRNHPRAAKDGTVCHDIWPHMVMTEALLTWYDFTGDKRLLKLLAGFAKWCVQVPYTEFLLGDSRGGNWHFSVQKDRACDIVPALFRLYALTHEKVFLEFADRCFRYRSRLGRNKTYLDSHNVNFAERFAYETIYWRRSRFPAHRAFADYWFTANAFTWGGEFPRWGFASDECARVGCFDARYGTETCTWGELVRSFQHLGALTGEPKWGDRAEDVVYNCYPVSFTPDWKKVHYLTAANQVSLDAATDHNYQKPPPRLAYSAKLYRCCRHNAGLTLPLFAEKLTQHTAAGELVFFAYAPHEGRVGDTAWALETRYPFREKMRLTLMNGGTRAIYLRIPKWAQGLDVRVDGKDVCRREGASGWLKLEGPWASRTVLDIAFEAAITFTPHVRSGGVTIERGPLSYSLAIKEEYRDVPEPTFKKDEAGILASHFPEAADMPSGDLMTEVLPASPWNYALDIRKTPTFAVRDWRDDCFAAESTPCVITAFGRKVPEWNAQDAQPAALQESPVRTQEREEQLAFIPMGAARLRLTVLPVYGEEGMMSYQWVRVKDKTIRAKRPKIISE